MEQMDYIYSLIRDGKMKNLGIANGWEETPQLIKDAKGKGFKVYSERGRYNGEYTYYCPEGGYYYTVWSD
jgi:hypothetical protein